MYARWHSVGSSLTSTLDDKFHWYSIGHQGFSLKTTFMKAPKVRCLPRMFETTVFSCNSKTYRGKSFPSVVFQKYRTILCLVKIYRSALGFNLGQEWNVQQSFHSGRCILHRALRGHTCCASKTCTNQLGDHDNAKLLQSTNEKLC